MQSIGVPHWSPKAGKVLADELCFDRNPAMICVCRCGIMHIGLSHGLNTLSVCCYVIIM